MKQGSRMKWAVATVCVAACLGLLFIAGKAKADGVKWSGCYVGAGLGYAASTTKADLGWPSYTLVSVDGFGADGATLSGIVGCDLQVNQLVFGIFGDYTWHQDHDIKLAALGGALSGSAGFDTQWSIGGRAGFLIKDVLLYGLVAYTNLESDGPTFTGYQVGGGIEVPLGAGFFGGLEYRYSLLDSERIPLGYGAGLDLDPTMHSVTARLTYKLGDLFGK